MDIKKNIRLIKNNIPSHVILIAVSKKHSISSIQEAYNYGQRDFGENYIQEMIIKYKSLPKDIRWHMIGRIQRNKLKIIIPFIHLIHGIEKITQLELINKEAAKYNRIINCLIQIKISNDKNYGIEIKDINNILYSKLYLDMKYVKIVGLMVISTNTKNINIIKNEFNLINIFFNKLKKINDSIRILSMGMSFDYKFAIYYGSNMIRLGNAIFGKRNII